MARRNQNTTEETGTGTTAEGGEVEEETALTHSEASEMTAGMEDTEALLKEMTGGAAEGLEKVQSGGISKWLDLRAFQEDPTVPKEEPVKGNGKGFAGYLLPGLHEIADKNAKEFNEQGEPVRFFFQLELTSPCPVSYKNENGKKTREMAKAGDIICVGERATLRGFRDWATDGGEYLVVVKPHSRIATKVEGNTVWTFDVWRKVIRPAIKVKAEIAPPPAATAGRRSLRAAG